MIDIQILPRDVDEIAKHLSSIGMLFSGGVHRNFARK